MSDFLSATGGSITDRKKGSALAGGIQIPYHYRVAAEFGPKVTHLMG
jgi:hypothetical protein